MAFNFAKKVEEVKNLKRRLPVQVGVLAVNHYKGSFRSQGYTDEGFTAWEKRKTKDKSDRAARNKDKPRAILVKTGHLKRSIRVRVATFDKIEIGAYGVPYAVFHNNGTGKLPKRQFMGRSAALNRKIKALIKREIDKIL